MKSLLRDERFTTNDSVGALVTHTGGSLGGKVHWEMYRRLIGWFCIGALAACGEPPLQTQTDGENEPQVSASQEELSLIWCVGERASRDERWQCMVYLSFYQLYCGRTGSRPNPYSAKCTRWLDGTYSCSVTLTTGNDSQFTCGWWEHTAPENPMSVNGYSVAYEPVSVQPGNNSAY